MHPKQTYTQREVMHRTGLSRARLSQMRLGHWRGGTRVAPLLIEGRDWHYDRSKHMYHGSALDIIASDRPPIRPRPARTPQDSPPTDGLNSDNP